ncbi:cupin domain-containing protein [uncultured Maritalea sp.]|uniref:helix-turn-helix domain-containing protein n=1 Tax=uncultured Maritalea sp. TaxID=757249 RepID=UPI0026068898|nr:cupin domain-containing protein [uncultured Maritalea sp.]
MVKKITPNNAIMSLGEKIRACRKQEKLTMQVLANRAGLSVGFISQVERNLTVPSLSSLTAIAGVLGHPMSHFVDQPLNVEEATRFGKRLSFRVGEGPLSYERISTSFEGSSLRSVIIHEPPGHRAEPISHDGEELFFVLRGEVTVELEGKRTVLKAGDTLHFDSSRQHSTWNHTNKAVSILWCGTMDVFGEEAINPIHRELNIAN